LTRFNDYNQIGDDMNGVNRVDFAGAGVALSRDGTTLVYGAPEDGNMMSYEDMMIPDRRGPGYVVVMRWNPQATQWEAAGTPLQGTGNLYRIFGASVAVSADGTRIAIGEPAPSTQASHVHAYTWDEYLGEWLPLPSPDGIVVSDSTSTCGVSVAISDDGSTIATGCAVHGYSREPGHAKVFKWDADNNVWAQRGADFPVARNGTQVALSSNGNVVAIGTSQRWSEYVYSNPLRAAGHVHVFEWDDALGDWVQRGETFFGEESSETGASVALSADGSVLAYGMPHFSSQGHRGDVAVHQWDGSSWVPKGTVMSDVGATQRSHMGESLALSTDGDVVAIGAHALHFSQDTMRDGHYHAHVYAWDSATSTWQEVGAGVDGGSDDGFLPTIPENPRAFSSVAISGDGTRMAYGAWPGRGYDGGMGYLSFTENDWSRGLVRVFDARWAR
jgi:hypothetical protein